MSLPQTHTLAEVAASLRVHPRTLRRAIARTDLPVTRVGAGVRLTDAQVVQLREAMECRLGSRGSATASGMPAGRSASGRKSGRSQNTAQEAVLARMRTILQRPETVKSAGKSRTALRVVHGASR